MKDLLLGFRRARRRLEVAAAAAAGAVAITVGGTAIAAEPVGPNLPPKLRGLLQQEMAAIVVAMEEVYGAIVRGDHDRVTGKAEAIHESFILDQSLTPEDRQTLQSAVPPRFLEMDRKFHQLAASLAKAGRQNDTREQVIRFSQMTESCVACHSQYVTDRFPGLREQEIPGTWGLGTEEQ